IGIILGAGLGNLIDDITIELSIDYSDILHFPVSTVEGHTGRLIFGTLSGKNVIAMQGRFHYYEGYSMQEVTFPIRVMKDRKSTRLNSSHVKISYAVFCLKKKIR